jgi:hypothetical protein
MNTAAWIVIAVVAVIVIALIAWAVARKQRTSRLQNRFGPEYDRTLDRTDSKKDAELDLRDRARERDKLDIQPLTAAARTRYAEEWRVVQQRFVDQPEQAVKDADDLVTAVMKDRGYPMSDFDTQASLVSVDHPSVVENYRSGHGIRERITDGRTSTEEMRRAFVHYRSLFDELLGDEPATDRDEVADPTTDSRR